MGGKGHVFDRGDQQVMEDPGRGGAEHAGPCRLPRVPCLTFCGFLAVSVTTTVTISPVYVER